MAGVELATAYVSLVVTPRDIKPQTRKALGEVETEAEKTGKRAGAKMSDGIKSSLKGLAPALGAGAVVAGLKSIVDQASDLEQSIGGVDAVFKGTASTIHKAAGEAASNLGLAKNEYNELATVIGAGLKNKGVQDFTGETQKLLTIGADLAAQYGGSTKEAVEALASAMRGESDPIERYGVALNETAVSAKLAQMGVEKAGGAYTEQQKTMGRLAIIAEQTKDAQGAFGREAETAAGKQQRLKANLADLTTELGTKLLPAYSAAVGAVGAFVKGMNEGNGAGGAFVDFLRDAQTVLAPVAKTLWDNREAVAAVAGSFVAFKAASAGIGLAKTGLDAVKTSIDGVRAASGAARTAFGIFKSGLDAGAAAATGGQFTTFAAALKGAAVNARASAIAAVASTRAWVANTAATVANTAATVAKSVAEKAAVVATKAVTAAQWLLNAALRANPIGIVITALTALVAAIVWAYKNNETFRRVVQQVWAAVRQAIGAVVDWFRNVAWPWMRDALAAMGRAFNAARDVIGRAWGSIRSTSGAAVTWIKGSVLTPLQNAVGAVATGFSRAKDAIARAWSGLRRAVSEPIEATIRFVKDRFVAPVNRVLSAAGVKPIRMATGGVLPGYTPGRDVHTFTGPAGTLNLSGGEGILRPEVVKAMGRDRFNRLNASARRGGVSGAARELGGSWSFAKGGVLDKIKQKGTDAIRAVGSIPRKMIEKVASLNVPGGGMFGQVVRSLGPKIIDSLAAKLRSALDAVEGGGGTGAKGVGGKGMGFPAMVRWIQAAYPGVRITSANFRTWGSPTSMHRKGRAVDMVAANMGALFETVKKGYGTGNITQLLYSPKGGKQVQYGRERDTSGQLRAIHWDHVHWSMAKGGVLPSLTPTLYDQGGLLKPGMTLVQNATGRPETVIPAPPGELIDYDLLAGALARQPMILDGAQINRANNARQAAMLSGGRTVSVL